MLATGGVCQILDYEIDQKAEYVAHMAQQLVLPTSPVTPAFRKFVSGLLTSTRLPSTTILLGMSYLSRRVNFMKRAGPYKANDGIVWRMVTIGLLLGSKFLDDNTFQNRSWSEVSGISVAELNTMEMDWLETMNWELYINLDTNQDYQQWLQSWDDWRKDKNAQRKTTLDRLAPLDTNVQRPRPAYPTPQYTPYLKNASRERPLSGYRSGYDQTAWKNSYPTPQTTPPYDQSWKNTYPTPHATPPSAPDSGVTTPEYLSATGGPQWPMYSQFPRSFGHCGYVAVQAAPWATPQFHYGYALNNGWERNANRNCGCGFCYPPLKQQSSMFANPYAYGQQIAA